MSTFVETPAIGDDVQTAYPSTPPAAARVHAAHPSPAVETPASPVQQLSWEEAQVEARALLEQWKREILTENALKAANNAAATLRSAEGAPPDDLNEWLASAYSAAADSLACLARVPRNTSAAEETRRAERRTAVALGIRPSHPHAMLAAAQLCVQASTPRLVAARTLLDELLRTLETFPSSCAFRADECSEKAEELRISLQTQLRSPMVCDLLKTTLSFSPVEQPQRVLDSPVRDVLKTYGTKTKAGRAFTLSLAELAALSPEQRVEMEVGSTAFGRAATLVTLLSRSQPSWLSGTAAAERALVDEAQESHLRVLCWNVQASLTTHGVPDCLPAKAASLAELLSDPVVGYPALLALQECPGTGVRDNPERPAIAGALAAVVCERWRYVQANTGSEAAGFLYDSDRVEPAGEEPFLHTYAEPDWPSPTEDPLYVPRPPVLALFRTCALAPTLLALLSVHLKSAKGTGFEAAAMARQQLGALSANVLPWAQHLAAAAAGQLPIAFLVLGDFNLHGRDDNSELIISDRTSPGDEWAGLTNAGFRPLLPRNSPSNLGRPICDVNCSYDHVWAHGVHPSSKAFVHRPLVLVEQLQELDDVRKWLSCVADVDQPARGGGMRRSLVATLAHEAAQWLKAHVRTGVNKEWSDHWPLIAELCFDPSS